MDQNDIFLPVKLFAMCKLFSITKQEIPYFQYITPSFCHTSITAAKYRGDTV